MCGWVLGTISLYYSHRRFIQWQNGGGNQGTFKLPKHVLCGLCIDKSDEQQPRENNRELAVTAEEFGICDGGNCQDSNEWKWHEYEGVLNSLCSRHTHGSASNSYSSTSNARNSRSTVESKPRSSSSSKSAYFHTIVSLR